MVTDQGIIQGDAHDLLMYRKQLLPHKRIKILADLLVKHATPLGQEADIKLVAKDTVIRGLADGVIVSGTATGSEPNLSHLKAVREALPDTPLFIGSGTSVQNVNTLLGTADGVIVASSLKRQGILENPIDVERVRALVSAARAASTAA